MDEQQDRTQADTAPPAEQTDRAPDGMGYLTVRVTTARGAIPLEGARVDIRSLGDEAQTDPAVRGDIVASLVSGRDGRTPRTPLPAPPAAISERPSGKPPFSRYSVEVSLLGYRDQTYLGIPIFDGVTSLQSAILVPLPEDGSGGTRPDEPQVFPEFGYPQL